MLVKLQNTRKFKCKCPFAEIPTILVIYMIK